MNSQKTEQGAQNQLRAQLTAEAADLLGQIPTDDPRRQEIAAWALERHFAHRLEVLAAGIGGAL